MEFLSEYYLWFVIGGIILVMALIGYIADKTDFGRKDITPKQTKNKNKTKEQNVQEISKDQDEEKISIEEPTISTQPIDIVPDVTLPMEESNELATDISDIDPFVMPEVVEEIQTDNNIQAVTEPSDGEMQNDVDIEIKEVTDDSTFALNNDLSVFEASDISNPVASTETVENNVAEVIGEDIPVEVTDGAINATLDEQDGEEDIWKF